MTDERTSATREERSAGEGRIPGIVIRHARGRGEPAELPRISAFIWGGKVRPQPTLPFGRWKGAA